MRRPLRLAAPALVLAALALAACQPEPAPSPSPSPTSAAPSESPAPGETTAPTASAAPAPGASTDAEARALPADCERAYSLQMQDSLYSEFGRLNPPDASRYPSSKVADLLDVIQGTPNLTCFWTPPGDRGLNTNAALIRPQHVALVKDVLAANFPGCETTGDEMRCSRQGEQIEGAVETESVVLRGDLLVTTLGLNADPAIVEEAVNDFLEHLPPR
jgi:hypothetical protein